MMSRPILGIYRSDVVIDQLDLIVMNIHMLQHLMVEK